MTTKNLISLVFGIVFLLVGVLGFFMDPVLGLFDVDLVHNIVHLASGIVGIAASRSQKFSDLYLKVFGAVYAAVTVLGFLWPSDHVLGIIHINTADDFLHLFLAAALLGAGFLIPTGSKNTTAQA